MTSAKVTTGFDSKSDTKVVLSIPPISNQVFVLSNKVYIGKLIDSNESDSKESDSKESGALVLDCAEGYWEFHKFEKTSKSYCCHYLGKKLLRKSDERPQLKYFHRFNGEDIGTIQSRDGIIGIFDEVVISKYLRICPKNNPLYQDVKNVMTISSVYKEGIGLHLSLNKTWSIHVIRDNHGIVNCIQILDNDFSFRGEYHDSLGKKSLQSMVETFSKEMKWDAERNVEVQKFDSLLDKKSLDEMQVLRRNLKTIPGEGFNLISIPASKNTTFVIRNRTVLGIIGEDSCHLRPINEELVILLRITYGYIYYFVEEGCDLFHTDEEKLNSTTPLMSTIALSPDSGSFSNTFTLPEATFRDTSIPVIISSKNDSKTAIPSANIINSLKPLDVDDLFSDGRNDYATISDIRYNRCVVITNGYLKCIGKLQENEDTQNLRPDFYKHLDPLTEQTIAELRNIYGLQYSYINGSD